MKLCYELLPGDRGSGLEVGSRVLGAGVDRRFRVSMDAKEASPIRITKVTKFFFFVVTPCMLLSYAIIIPTTAHI